MAWWTRVREALRSLRRKWGRTRMWRDHLLRIVALATMGIVILWVIDFNKTVTVPDVEGVNIARAVERLRDAGIDFEAEDVYGIVTRQWPQPGGEKHRWQDVTLTYEFEGEELKISGG